MGIWESGLNKLSELMGSEQLRLSDKIITIYYPWDCGFLLCVNCRTRGGLGSGAINTHVFVKTLAEKKSCGRPRFGWNGTIKVDLIKIRGWVYVQWILVAQ